MTSIVRTANDTITWKEACSDLGLNFVKKDTPDYNRVKTYYNQFKHASVAAKPKVTWQDACQAVGYEYVIKGTSEYERAKKYYDDAFALDGEKVLWKKACMRAGFEFVKKGTPDYDKVKAFYIEMSDPSYVEVKTDFPPQPQLTRDISQLISTGTLKINSL